MTPTPNPTAESVIAEAVPYTTVATAEGEHSQAIRARLLSEGAPSEEQIARVRRMLRPFGLGDACTDRDLSQALTAAGVAPQKPSASDRDTWLCGKCEREKMLGRDDGQIAEHHRTCSVGMVPPPPTDREKLIAEATEFIDSWDRLGSWTPDSPIGMVMRLRNALAAPLDPVKVAEVERAAAARALDQIADILDGYAGTILNAESASDIVRARAAEMREGKLT